MTGRTAWGLLLSLLVLTTAPAVASAADTYVNEDGGTDLNPCTQAEPCGTVQKGINTAGAGETVHVDHGTYTGGVTLGGGKSLIEDNFNTADGDPVADTIIAAGGATALEVSAGNAAGTIQGLTLQSTNNVVRLFAGATLTGNRIDQGPSNGPFIIGQDSSPTISGNVLVDASPTDTSLGIDLSGSGSPTISGNQLSGFIGGISVSGGEVSGNTLTGVHDVPMSNSGFGISASNGTATIRENRVTGTATPGDAVFGISIFQSVGFTTTVTARRNLVRATTYGAIVQETDNVTFSGDVFTPNPGGEALRGTDPFMGGGGGLVTATNVTFNGYIRVDNGADLTIDSSIVRDGILDVNAGTNCTITFSAGPTTGTGCDNFQEPADPMLAADGIHLLAGSPMIDAGNPAAPAAGDAEFDGDSRQLDGNGDGVARRDIGADEFVTPTPAGDSPAGEDPRCAILRAKLEKAKKRLKAAKQAGKPTRKKRKKVRRLKRELRALGCP